SRSIVIQARPLLAKALAAGVQTRHPAAIAGAPASPRQALQREILLFTLGRPDRNDLLARLRAGDFRHEPRSPVHSLQLCRRGGYVVINRPAALQVAAAARRRAALQIVQQHPAITCGNAGQQPLDSPALGLVSFSITNRNPGPGLGDLALLERA